jgi:hypothetical protein
MGFDPLTLLAAGGGAIGAVQAADAAGQAEDIQKKARAKAIADAADQVTKQKAEQQRTLNLSTAFNSLATYQAKSAGDASTQYTGKRGLANGVVY